MSNCATLAADASRLASLLVAYILPVCALLAPRQAGASTPIGGTLIHGRVLTALLVTAALSVLVPRAASMQEPQPTRIDVSKLGPQVGERVPDFILQDQNGRTQTLQSIMGPRGAMLVFVRSADW